MTLLTSLITIVILHALIGLVLTWNDFTYWFRVDRTLRGKLEVIWQQFLVCVAWLPVFVYASIRDAIVRHRSSNASR